MTNTDLSIEHFNETTGAARGWYLGRPFEGTVTKVRPCYGTAMEFTIDLSEKPIQFFGETRTEIAMNFDGPKHKDLIERAYRFAA